MAFLKFFRVPKHQQFEYKPRYWDPRKEELQERLKEIEARKNNDVDGMKSRIAAGMRRGITSSQTKRLRQRKVMRSNLTLFAVLVLLVLSAYVFLVQYLPRIVEALEGNSAQM